jgi:hypothetical protein
VPVKRTAAVADTQPMTAARDDWRRMGQEVYLHGATLTWKHYQALSAEWEHEHCEFCFRTFIDAHYSPQGAKAPRDRPEKQTDAGYTNVEASVWAPGEYWAICAG